ncbi:M16 family metallopeptidase [Arenibaculum pallidiluteum]|uniref:M16 family metallopeptidase n=1 Tax=Arenibaculum pallidiluteum TaxID=2812559 RepID=UPI002E27F05E|nr:pitrilysin family protein [Arenibaculum pallidiluteum]
MKPIPTLAALMFLAAAPAGAQAPPSPAPAPPGQPAPAQASATAQQGVFFPEIFTLQNGMQVVVVTNRRVPVVTHMVWYRTGAADEPRGRSGIAHFLEHLMFKATDELAAGEFSRIVARNGGRDNAFTSWDYTAYFQNVARDRLELVMKMEADRMADLRLTDEVVLPEREVIIEERRQRTENSPSDKLSEQLQAALFVHHPYGTPVIGWESEMRKLDREAAEAFYRTWYAPNNAILVVAGDVDAAELKPLAERYYGAIPARPVPARVRVEEPVLTAERRVILRDAEVRQPSLRRLYQAPSYRAGAKEHAYALQVLSEILGGGATSRLHRALVLDQRLAVGAGSGYSPTAVDLGIFGLYLTPVPAVDLDRLEAAMDAEIAKLLKEGVTAEEVETAKLRMQREAIFARDSLQGPAQTLGAALATGGTAEEVEQWPARIGAVTPDQVMAAARFLLTQTGFATGILLPAEGSAVAGAPRPGTAASAGGAASPAAPSAAGAAQGAVR